jgi:hypothetical protein
MRGRVIVGDPRPGPTPGARHGHKFRIRLVSFLLSTDLGDGDDLLHSV